MSDTDAPAGEDSLDRFLSRARPEAPPGLDERTAAVVAAALAGKKQFWSLVEQHSKRALAAALLLLAVGVGLVVRSPARAARPSDTDLTIPERDAPITIDHVAQAVAAPGSTFHDSRDVLIEGGGE